jgi:hypothetical protein
MKNRVLMFVAIALTLAISAGAAYNQPHRPATMMLEAGRCCGDPICPSPPAPCQPAAFNAAFTAVFTASRAPRFQSRR